MNYLWEMAENRIKIKVHTGKMKGKTGYIIAVKGNEFLILFYNNVKQWVNRNDVDDV